MIGQPSPPVEVPGGLGILVVCERTDSGVDRAKIRDRLSGQRLDMLARRYMRDLRRSANVEAHGRANMVEAAGRLAGPAAGARGGDKRRKANNSKGPVTDGTFFLC